MEFKDKIKKWDDVYCEQHVTNLVNGIYNIFSKNDINQISYLDIGANVGKVYDLLSKKISIKKACLIEASPILYEYIKEKYYNDNKIKTFNFAISDIDGVIKFDESSMIYQFNENVESLNLGLSKIGNYNSSKEVDSTKISTFINNNDELYEEINFIKIDTESVDFDILNDLLSIIDKFKTLPVIEFEVNYFVSNHSKEWAQDILNKFSKKSYYELNISDCHGDGVLLPKNFKI